MRRAIPLLLVFTAGPAAAQEPAAPRPPRAATEISCTACLVLPPTGAGGRAAFRADPIEAALVARTLGAPAAGDTVPLGDGETRSWRDASADAEGWIADRALAGGWAAWTVDTDAPRTMVLEAVGHEVVFVDGVPRTGDLYGTGHVRLPVELRGGGCRFLFRVGRGRLKARLLPADPPLAIDVGDATLPDLVVGERADTQGAIVVRNATAGPLVGATLAASGPGLQETRVAIPPVPPWGVRKVPFGLVGPAPAADAPESLEVTFALHATDVAPHRATVTLRVRRPDQSRKRTFESAIDGSLQYYAVQPWRRTEASPAHAGLILTLHGAGVEAIGQADAYAPKTWAHVVAATNRRPFGFDWEDWGRLDALEVLDHATRALDPDPARIYLTGHSMGGHGTWHVGLTHPDRFAALGPSAGWVSMFSYAGMSAQAGGDPIAELLLRAARPSDTLALARNSLASGLYILHGVDDDNVPVREARTIREHLAPFHRDLAWHEEPGQKHWWDVSKERGADCVDWAPMTDFFARHARPPVAAVRTVEFVTAHPGISAACHWVTIHAATKPFVPCRVVLRADPHDRRITGTTENVAVLALDLAPLVPGGPVSLTLDGHALADVPWPAGGRLWLARIGDRWATAAAPAPATKGPHRAGPLKLAFTNRATLVYGTAGTADENAWALAKARYDAEVFWYRGNGSLEVLSDAEWLGPAPPRPGPPNEARNVILYGNADTNRAWASVLGACPVHVGQGVIRLGARTWEGPDLAAMFIRPRAGSDVASVAVIGGTGPVGMRATTRIPLFVSGVGLPDVLVFGADVWTKGVPGVRAAGFFGNDWSVEAGELAVR